VHRGRILDRDLVARAQRGDESALAELVDSIGDRMYAVAQHILRDSGRADDATQQAMIDIWRKLPTLRDPDRFLAWAYRIVLRSTSAEAANRRRWFARVNLAAVLPTTTAGLEASVIERDELDRALDRLPVDQRAVIVLKHFAGLSNAEVADALGVAEGTVRSRLYYAASSLRASLDAEQRATRRLREP
jgi:RNA polymerase sigma-70 factor, ECF subfamily